MKKYLAAALILLSAPAIAQKHPLDGVVERHIYAQMVTLPLSGALTPEQRRLSLENWVSFIVNGRVKKEWTPTLYAAPDTAAMLGTIDGMVVAADPSMKEGRLQMRNAEAFPDTHQFTRQPIVVPAGSVMAEQTW